MLFYEIYLEYALVWFGTSLLRSQPYRLTLMKRFSSQEEGDHNTKIPTRTEVHVEWSVVVVFN